MTSTLAFLLDVAGERPVPETLAQYDIWASTFEQDVESSGITGPTSFAQFFNAQGINKDAMILDAGAGTGRLGRLLTAMDYTNLHALDGSAQMLNQALKGDTYHSYTQAMLGIGHTIPLPDDHFDAVVMVGVFVPGHFGFDVFPELLRITKPGGVVCWGQRKPQMYGDKSDAYKGDNFHKSILKVCDECPCTLVKGPVPLPLYYLHHDGQGYVLRKNN